jgi:hypothetical protein
MRVMLVLLLATVSVTAKSQGVPTRTVATPVALYTDPFSDIRAIRELSNGNVIVIDRKEVTVQIVDFQRGTAMIVGRIGGGPGEYRIPSDLYALPGDTTVLRDASGGRLLVIGPDGKPGAFLDPNRELGADEQAQAFRVFVRASDGLGRFYGERQPLRIGANGRLELSDSAAIIRIDRTTLRKDTVAMVPERADANARLIGGMVVTQPRMYALPAWDHWLVARDGRIAIVTYEPYRVAYVTPDGRRIQGEPIPYARIRVDAALKDQFMAERNQVRAGRPTPPAPTAWPEVLPPYLGSAVFASDGLLWIPRAVAAGRPPLYDIIDGNGRLVERVELPARHKLVGFGKDVIYLVRLDEDDLQYLQRHPLPTSARP